MAADIISGIGGAVQGEECVRLWSTRRISLPGMAICSASDGSVVRGPGIADWEGVYAGFGYQPTNLAGDLFQFAGATRDGKGATSVADGAIVAQTNIDWDIEGNKFIEYTNFFMAATGVLTYGSASASDTSTPNPTQSRDATLSLTGCIELRKMQLVLISLNPKAVTAATAGRTERVPGNQDARFTAKIYTKDANFPAEEAIVETLFGVGGGLFWTLKWMIITLTAPLLPLGGGLFEADIAGKFTGFTGGAKGNITAPDGTIWWN